MGNKKGNKKRVIEDNKKRVLYEDMVEQIAKDHNLKAQIDVVKTKSNRGNPIPPKTTVRYKTIPEITKEAGIKISTSNVKISEGGGWYSNGKRYVYKGTFCDE